MDKNKSSIIASTKKYLKEYLPLKLKDETITADAERTKALYTL